MKKRIPAHRRLPIALGVIIVAGFAVGLGVSVLKPFHEATATAGKLPTSVRYRTLPGHTETRFKTRRVRVVKYRHGKRVVSYRTITQPVSVFVPPTTVAVTGPTRTTVRTVNGTVIRTVTTALPGTTIIRTTTVTGPGTTVTGPTTTITGPTVTTTETSPPPPPVTTTVDCTVDTNGATLGCS